MKILKLTNLRLPHAPDTLTELLVEDGRFVAAFRNQETEIGRAHV